MHTCPRCKGFVVSMYSDCYCINCGCRPLVYHMRDQWEPDGQQVPKLRVSMQRDSPLTMHEQIQLALFKSRGELRAVRA